jgi:hypothetical protein
MALTEFTILLVSSLGASILLLIFIFVRLIAALSMGQLRK